MKAIIAKEHRENLKWAGLMMVGIGLWMAYALDRDSVNLFGVLSAEFLVVTAMGFSCAGFTLGLLQTLQDQRRGRWAFVVHRPVARGRIFWGKVVAGSILYFGAMTLPFAVAVIWSAAAGRRGAPFEWHMILPGASDLVGGWVYYCAGLLIGMRKARWVGSRILPLGVPFFTSLLVMGFAYEFIDALGIWACAACIVLPAAWGAFVAGGEERVRPGAVLAAQSVNVAVGLLMLFFIGIAISLQVLESIAPKLNGSTSNSWYYVRNDGEIVRAGIGASGLEKLTDLQGHALANQDSADLYSHRTDENVLNLQGVAPEDLSLTDRVTAFGFHSSDGQLRQFMFSQSSPGFAWIYVAQRQTIEGFDSNAYEHPYIGSIGPDATGRFPEPLFNFVAHGSADKHCYLVAGRTTAYAVDFEARRAMTFFASAPDDPIKDAVWVWSSPTLDYFAIATKTAVHIVTQHGEVFRMPLEQGELGPTSVAVGKTLNDQYVFRFRTGEYSWLDKPGTKQWVVKTDMNGNLLSRTDLPPLPKPVVIATNWLDEMGQVLLPVSLMGGYELAGGQGDFPPASRFVYEAGLVWVLCVGVGLRLFPRYGIKGGAAVLWVVIVALLEIPGVLLMISLRDRLAMVKCPSCGRLRSVKSEKCPRCSAPFVKPAEEGIEVMELSLL